MTVTVHLLPSHHWMFVCEEVLMNCPGCGIKAWYQGEVLDDGTLPAETICPKCDAAHWIRLANWQPPEPPVPHPQFCGQLAGRGGEPRDSNPLTPNTDAWRQWDQGWKEGIG